MPIVQVSIRGLSSLLQHAFGAEFQNPDPARAQLVNQRTPREEAEQACYREADDSIFFPGACISRLLREAGGGHKMKGTRKSVKFLVPAAVVVPDDHIPLLDYEGNPLTTFEVDSRPVTIPSTKGRIMRHRPRFDKWQANFSLEVDSGVLPVELIHQLLEEGGRRQGIGDYRPEKGGPFGRFEVLSWQVVD